MKAASGGVARRLLPITRSGVLSGATVAFREPETVPGPGLPPQGYRLEISPDVVRLAAADPAGAFYGAQTLGQLRRLCGGGLTPGWIEDWPDLATRGVLLDVSRARVPTIATLEALVDRLASFKVNHLELYFEHTFAYAGHEEVWTGTDPFTAPELAALDRYCAARHVELTANQATLGHLERWLAHPRYLPLAAAPQGWTSPEGRRLPPGTLDPANPASRSLVEDLLDQLVPCFTSRRVHVGLDEPWELLGRREDEWASYLDWLRGLDVLQGKELLVWGDVPAGRPELISGLPDGVTVTEWGYEADHPFTAHAGALARAGMPFWCCPGTSTWNSVTGRLHNALDNCAAAAEAARELGAQGYLVTDWGDGASQQPQAFVEVPLALGAALGWCVEANSKLDIAGALSAQVFEDDTGASGTAVVGLANAYRAFGAPMRNASALARLLWRPEEAIAAPPFEDAGVPAVERAAEQIAAAAAEIPRARPTRADARLVIDELSYGADLLSWCCLDARARLDGNGTPGGIAPARRRELGRQVAELAERHAGCYLARNRPGPLDESLGPLRTLAQIYGA
ncbi:MAG: glycoside hydrolase, family 20 [Acidimicrobiaceae bacterium]|nr:glycoside hydrolase, family 20 [Acidimicrobiaceae bacterium]